jgi:TolB-like protein/DNA-binding winged helix-turn-helix (wHTH) protein
VTRRSEPALRVGEWCVRPASGQISRGGETVRLEARTMRLLVCLAERAGEIVSIDELLDRVWSGVTVAPDSVYQAVASLRRILGDDPKQPTYIVTAPRLGYQLVAPVGPWDDSTATPESPPESPPQSPPSHWGRWIYPVASLAVALVAAVVLGVWIAGGAPKNSEAAAPAAPPQTSIAVLPFLDLTDAMKHEVFVDGMTEELVDKLSKIPGVRVPPARTSLSFKGKNASIREVAATLGTTFVLDGSVRQSGTALRVAARLVRADTGFVVWSETYDRSSGDLVAIEDDIATEVAKSLKVPVEGGS